MRAKKWFEQGGNMPYFKTAPFFLMLQKHPEYSTFLELNKTNISKQKAIFQNTQTDLNDSF